MSVKRILVVCLVVALLYSSLNPLSEAFLANTETQQPEFSNTDSDLEMKIQLPGAVWEADSVVYWSPSDFDENRVMQFSVSLSNNIDIEDISQISVSLISLEGRTPNRLLTTHLSSCNPARELFRFNHSNNDRCHINDSKLGNKDEKLLTRIEL